MKYETGYQPNLLVTSTNIEQSEMWKLQNNVGHSFSEKKKKLTTSIFVAVLVKQTTVDSETTQQAANTNISISPCHEK